MTQQSDSDLQKKIHRASLLMVASVLGSRVIGFFREWVLAHTIGANAMTDVYYASFTIPDFLNYLLAAGALSISFIPVLSSLIHGGKSDIARRVFRCLSTVMGLILIVTIAITMIFASELALWVAPGFTGEKRDLLASLLRIILPAQFFFYWGGLAIAIQQTHGRFFLPALAPLAYNACIIVCGLALHQSHGVAGFSIGVLVGSILSQGLLQWVGIRQLGYPIAPFFTRDPEVWRPIRRYFWLTLPVMLGFSVVVTDEWFSKYFASRLEDRAVSWLSYARTEMRIPIAVIGQAAGIASFPFLSKLWAEKSYEHFGRTLLKEIQKLWAGAPVATVLLMTHALPITHAIYGGGRLTQADLENTASALEMFGLGVFFWTVQVLLARGFYARQKTWLPSLLGTAISIAVFPMYRVFADKWSYEGLALAGSVSITVYTVLLWGMLFRNLRQHSPTLPFSRFYLFCGLWLIFVGVLVAAAKGVSALHIYQQTQLSALADVVLVTAVVGALAWGALRTVFAKLTDGPLF